jgi:hypothetical protein
MEKKLRQDLICLCPCTVVIVKKHLSGIIQELRLRIPEDGDECRLIEEEIILDSDRHLP